MTDFPDLEAAYEAETQTVYGMKFVELDTLQQILVRRSVENILAAALGSRVLYSTHDGLESPLAGAERYLRDFMGTAADVHDWSLSPDGMFQVWPKEDADE